MKTNAEKIEKVLMKIVKGKKDKISCPNCGKRYIPVLARKNNKSIQTQYPYAEKWEREQLISGLCSDKCWDEWLRGK